MQKKKMNGYKSHKYNYQCGGLRSSIVKAFFKYLNERRNKIPGQ